jgi:ABC-2 type transport system ATP-binding protein
VSQPVIEVRGLHKAYGPVEAVRGIDLVVERGEIFALLGPNGAGKTTTVEILEGHRRRDAGEAAVLGTDPWRAGRSFRARIGIVLQSTGVQPYLTVEEAIDLYGGYYPDPLQRDEVIELVGLGDKRKERVIRLSGGQQRRLDVAIGLVGNPELLFLDEPTTGFDPTARRNAWGMVRGLQSLGKTVFLTTHYMDEAQALSGRVAIIAGGRIVAEGSPANLAGAGDAVTTIRFRVTPGARNLPDRFRSSPGGTVEIHSRDPVRDVHEITGWALDNGVALEGLEVVRPSLEDVYLALTKEPDA